MRITILLFFLGFTLFSAQNKSFLYDFDYRKNLKKDSLTHDKMVLDVVGSESVFRKVKEKRNDSIFAATGNNPSLNMGFENQFYVKKNLKNQEVYKLIENFRDNFSLKIEEPLNWKISGEKKKIGEINCQKATVNYGGRNWTAWFTQEIPLQEGPYIFHGLPGMIAEIYDEKNDYRFTLTQIKKGGTDLFFTRKTLPINWKTFTKLATEYYQDPYKNTKPNSAGMGGNVKVKYTDENGNEIIPDFNQWTKNEQNTIRSNNNPIELNHKIDYK